MTPMQTYLLAALRHEPLSRAPDAYIVSYFDAFADEFDRKLVDVLEYRAPRELAELIERESVAADAVLDLGCGTGLAGPLLSRPGRRLVGVDLSPRMLEKARARGAYDLLIEAELTAYLAQASEVFDVVYLADVLIYFGGLEAFLPAVSRLIRPGGLLALTVETSEREPFALLHSGRFAHRLDYVLGLAAEAGLNSRQVVPSRIRRDAAGPATGALIILKRA